MLVQQRKRFPETPRSESLPGLKPLHSELLPASHQSQKDTSQKYPSHVFVLSAESVFYQQMIRDARVLRAGFVPREVEHRDAEVNHLSSVLDHER